MAENADLKRDEGLPSCDQRDQQRNDALGEWTVAVQQCDWHVPLGWLCG